MNDDIMVARRGKEKLNNKTYWKCVTKKQGQGVCGQRYNNPIV